MSETTIYVINCYLSLLFVKTTYFIPIFLFSLISFSQEKFSKEFTFITDNDLYVSFDRDRYYTSGIFLNYRYLVDTKSDKEEKRIVEWQLGHEMYNPNKPTVEFISQHDRPFAAYLFGSFGVSRVYKKKRILTTAFQIGTIGPNALGEEVQDFVHSFYGFQDVLGWKYQISNALGLNFNFEYLQFISQSETKGFDMTWINKGRIGTIYTNLSTGLLMRFGFKPLTNMLNSVEFGTHLNNEKTEFNRQVESYFFMKPMLRYALYDATLQGSFLNSSSMVTKELVPIVFDIAIGIKFTARRLNFGYTFNYNTSKSEGLRYTYGNKYGSLIFSYLIH